MDQLTAMNRAAYQAVLDDVCRNLQTVTAAIASCESELADREARLRVLHLQRAQLADTRERYEAFLANRPAPASHEAGRGNLAVGEADGGCPACKGTDDAGPPF